MKDFRQLFQGVGLIFGPILFIKERMTIFDEKNKVVAVESQCLVICGVLSGNVLVINTVPEFPPNEGAFSPGQLITLSDPAAGAAKAQ